MQSKLFVDEELLKKYDCERGALFSSCGKYRFKLWRIWNHQVPFIMFIGLNPSTANEVDDDPTIRRVIGLARKWGFGGVYMLNLFTYISSNPDKLLSCENPVFAADFWLKKEAKGIDTIVFAWGNFKIAEERAKEVTAMLPQAYCLKKNKNGSPMHPLYVPKDAHLKKW